MRFSVPTFEITDEEAKAIAKARGIKYCKRDDARAFALEAVSAAIAAALAPPASAEPAGLHLVEEAPGQEEISVSQGGMSATVTAAGTVATQSLQY